MAQKPILMEQIKQVQQLHQDGISIKEIQRRVAIVCVNISDFWMVKAH
jgi:hypothetical protein